MAVFEVLIIAKPKDEKEDLEKIIFGPKTIVAKSAESAGMQAVFSPEVKNNIIDPDRIKVIIRPFSQAG